MPVGALVTVPEPVPALVTVKVKPEPLHSPDQPAKVEPEAGAAVRVTEVPEA